MSPGATGIVLELNVQYVLLELSEIWPLFASIT